MTSDVGGGSGLVTWIAAPKQAVDSTRFCLCEEGSICISHSQPLSLKLPWAGEWVEEASTFGAVPAAHASLDPPVEVGKWLWLCLDH